MESRLRFVHNRSGTDLPENPEELVRLARWLNYGEPDPSTSADASRADAARLGHAAEHRLSRHMVRAA